VWGLRLNLRDSGLFEEEVAEKGESAPVAALEGGGIGTGCYGGVKGGSDSAQRVGQKIVLWAHHD